jgi:hypothetical protein
MKTALELDSFVWNTNMAACAMAFVELVPGE